MRGDFTRHEAERRKLIAQARQHLGDSHDADIRATKLGNKMLRKMIGGPAYDRHMGRLSHGWTYKPDTEVFQGG